MQGHYTIHENVRATVNDYGGVLLNLDTGVLFSVNSVGARLWAMLERGLGACGMLDSLHADFGVARSQLQTDIDAFFLALRENGLVK